MNAQVTAAIGHNSASYLQMASTICLAIGSIPHTTIRF